MFDNMRHDLFTKVLKNKKLPILIRHGSDRSRNSRTVVPYGMHYMFLICQRFSKPTQFLKYQSKARGSWHNSSGVDGYVDGEQK